MATVVELAEKRAEQSYYEAHPDERPAELLPSSGFRLPEHLKGVRVLRDEVVLVVEADSGVFVKWTTEPGSRFVEERGENGKTIYRLVKTR